MEGRLREILIDLRNLNKIKPSTDKKKEQSRRMQERSQILSFKFSVQTYTAGHRYYQVCKDKQIK